MTKLTKSAAITKYTDPATGVWRIGQEMPATSLHPIVEDNWDSQLNSPDLLPANPNIDNNQIFGVSDTDGNNYGTTLLQLKNFVNPSGGGIIVTNPADQTQLTSADDGKIFVINDQGADTTILLPDTGVAGLSFGFWTRDFKLTIKNTASGTAQIHGYSLANRQLESKPARNQSGVRFENYCVLQYVSDVDVVFKSRQGYWYFQFQQDLNFISDALMSDNIKGMQFVQVNPTGSPFPVDLMNEQFIQGNSEKRFYIEATGSFEISAQDLEWNGNTVYAIVKNVSTSDIKVSTPIHIDENEINADNGSIWIEPNKYGYIEYVQIEPPTAGDSTNKVVAVNTNSNKYDKSPSKSFPYDTAFATTGIPRSREGDFIVDCNGAILIDMDTGRNYKVTYHGEYISGVVPNISTLTPATVQVYGEYIAGRAHLWEAEVVEAGNFVKRLIVKITPQYI